MSNEPTAHRPRNVLLLVPAMNEDHRACTDLSVGRTPERTHLLSVLFTGGPDTKLAAWQSHVGELPGELTSVSVGGQRRATTTEGIAADRSGFTLEVVEEPRDLTGLAMRISGQLSQWDADASDVRFCFDSLTALVQYADLERSFRFLHVLTGRLNEMGAVAHFHLDPDAVDDRTARTLGQLFDETVRAGEIEEVDTGNTDRGTASPTDVGSRG